MAKLPLRFIPIGERFGDHEAAETLSLPVSLSPDGCKDIWLDKFARLTNINGFVRQNAAAITSDVGAQSMRLRALYHFVRQVAGSSQGVERQEIGIFDAGTGGLNHFEIRRSLDRGQTWGLISDLGVGYIDHIPSFGQLGNLLLMAFGQDVIRTWDGVNFGSAVSTQLAAPTLVDDGAGQINGTVRYKIVPRKADGTRKAASLWSVRTTFANRRVLVNWAADAEAANYEIYRTSGTGEIGFSLGTVAAGTLTFTDNVNDLELIAGRMLQEYGDPPPAGIFHVFVHKNRVFYLRTNDNPRRAYYSDPGLPYSVHFDSSFMDFSDADTFADRATGGIGDYKGMGIVFEENCIWTINGTGQRTGIGIDFQPRKSSAQVGTVHVNTVIRVSQGAKYLDYDGSLAQISQNVLAYLTPLGDLRIFDGENDAIIGHAKASTFARLSRAAREKSYAYTDTLRHEHVWVFPVDDGSEPSIAVAWNYQFGTMTERNWDFACVHEIETETQTRMLLAGESDKSVGGFCYQLWNGRLSKHGNVIRSQVMTKTLYGAGGSFSKSGMADAALTQYEKRWRWSEFLIKSDGNAKFLVEWWAGEADPTDTPAAYSVMGQSLSRVNTSDATGVQSSDAQAIYAPNTKSTVRVKHSDSGGRYLHSRGMRVRIAQWLWVEAVLKTRPLGWWRFGELTGITAYDQLGLNPLTYIGAVGLPTLGVQTGAIGDGNTGVQTLLANGQYMSGGLVAAFDFTTAYSVAVAFRPDVIPFGGSPTYGMVEKFGDPGGGNRGWQIRLQSNAAVTFSHRNAAASAFDWSFGTPFAVAGQNAFHVSTWDGTGGVGAAKQYLAGALHSSATPTTGVVSAATTKNFTIGANSDATFGSNITFDEVLVWDRALTAAEIALMNGALLEVPRQWSLAGMMTAYQVLPGLKREFRQ